MILLVIARLSSLLIDLLPLAAYYNLSMIICIGNQKGGTGKTSTVFAMAEVFAGAFKKKVLVLDLVPQVRLTTAAKTKGSV